MGSLTSPAIPRSADRNAVPQIERLPWSVIGPEFIDTWGRPRGKVMPEHLEILGPTGSGKGHALVHILLERVRRRKTSVVYIATKNADATTEQLGWPIVDDWRGVQKHEQVIFWPRTSLTGEEREKYQAAKIQELLDRLWQPGANTVVVFDEFVFIEGLNSRLRALLNMYLREGRSHGLTCVAGKQRVQGSQRDMHSESDWKLAFKMNDLDDNERLAQLFGAKRAYVPIIESLDREKHEFLIQHKLTGSQFISWIDTALPKPSPANGDSGYLRRR